MAFQSAFQSSPADSQKRYSSAVVDDDRNVNSGMGVPTHLKKQLIEPYPSELHRVKPTISTAATPGILGLESPGKFRVSGTILAHPVWVFWFPNAFGGFGDQSSMQAHFMASTTSFGNSEGVDDAAETPASKELQDHKPVGGLFDTCTSSSRKSIDEIIAVAAAVASSEKPQSKKFGDLDIKCISHLEAVFYFGIISLVAGLCSESSYKTSGRGNWTATITYRGERASAHIPFRDKFIARAETCRIALRGLEMDSNLNVPELPGHAMGLTPLCQCYRLAPPDFTRYVNGDGFRYKVDVGGTSYFGAHKFYKTATEAIHGSAHAALRSFLITEPENTSLFRGIGFGRGIPATTPKEKETARAENPPAQSQPRNNRLLKQFRDDGQPDSKLWLVTPVRLRESLSRPVVTRLPRNRPTRRAKRKARSEGKISTAETPSSSEPNAPEIPSSEIDMVLRRSIVNSLERAGCGILARSIPFRPRRPS
ncbi:hypothetical protein ACO22_01346 [Paracoccidioides brasiliensis]|uniref:Uncharacterized protein n=1 Tax=Paracoccidioides brasiliensis TaxID=121759 RepID=A0A1D2JLW9_PARBR|nr:hypothetical protein ACO22_01346 [Paracoccidioides brasiliensis]